MNRRFSQDAYAAYLKSPEWASKRSQRLEHDGWRCTGCGEDGTDAATGGPPSDLTSELALSASRIS